MPSRDWIPAPLQQFYEAHASAYRAMPSADLDASLHDLIARHEQYMDRECISLYAGTNLINPKAARLLSSSVGGRPSLGYPGDKYEMGMQYAEQIEIMAVEVLKDLFGCQYVEYRVGSGSLANLYAFMACTKAGDTILAFSEAAAGHVTHHQAGAAGWYGLTTYEVPYDAAQMTVDLEALRQTAHDQRPAMILIAGSCCLFPYPVREVRAIADEVGAIVMYDAAHMSGLIAGAAFQQPLAEGAHLMTTSTYKSFGGPASGLLLTDDPQIAALLDKVAYPGLTANFDLGKTAALILAALDLKEHGREYAAMCIANAQALAQALESQGVAVHQVAGKGFTQSQHVALPAHAYGGGHRGSRWLEPTNILTSGIGLPLAPIPNDFNAIRLGTQEITRQGMTPDHMPQIAAWMARRLLHNDPAEPIQQAVIEFRRSFQGLRYIRE